MIDSGPTLEQDPTGRTEVPDAFKNAFKPVINASTGLQKGTIEVSTQESIFSRARRALSKVVKGLDTNKENIRPPWKPF